MGDAYGQADWSPFAVSNGFRFVDDLWATEYHYDDPRLAEALDWYASLWQEKGYAPRIEQISGLGGNTFFASGGAALTTNGSWMTNWYGDNSDFEVGFAKLPLGPEGRKSMFNGLADSIWVGTQHPEEAWQWVKFLASPECQNIVGDHAVVFPALQSGVDNALKAFGEKGLDVTAFTEQALDPNATFLFPVTSNGAQISSMMTPVMDSIALGQAEPSAVLPQVDQRVDALFE